MESQPSCPASNAAPANVLPIAVPMLHEGDYMYIAVKGSLYTKDCAVFGLNAEEIHALAKRFGNSPTEIINGVMIKAAPIQVINSLSQLGYKVVSSTGEGEVIWTLSREV